ncbi:hypothetical protein CAUPRSCDRAFT_11041 [Caulochytrium protostelioides]|uniref:Uncharacterized protein n=1 Tax=Caulochytrium protostelioides TaxID=1555241 RepID=A0A4P9WX26_9FUNG|nr:hypothetical protein CAUPRSCDRAFT_11041 [Caulochytrium protostelioides]
MREHAASVPGALPANGSSTEVSRGLSEDDHHRPWGLATNAPEHHVHLVSHGALVQALWFIEGLNAPQRDQRRLALHDENAAIPVSDTALDWLDAATNWIVTTGLDAGHEYGPPGILFLSAAPRADTKCGWSEDFHQRLRMAGIEAVYHPPHHDRKILPYLHCCFTNDLWRLQVCPTAPPELGVRGITLRADAPHNRVSWFRGSDGRVHGMAGVPAPPGDPNAPRTQDVPVAQPTAA